jgi:hypothetical protein
VSPLWRDQLGVVLYPDHLVLVRVKTGLRRRLQHSEVMPTPSPEAEAPAWSAAVEALKPLAASEILGGADVTLVLSSAFVRYVLVPRSAALSSEEEQVAFARHRFGAIHGKEIEDWIIRLSPGHKGQPRLACAIERSLVEALDQAMAPLGARYQSLQPHLAKSLNCWRAEMAKRALWFVVVESGVMSVALVRNGEFTSLRTMRVGGGWIDDLPGVLAREELLNDASDGSNEVLVLGPPDQHVPEAAAGKWKFRALRPGTISNATLAATDAPFFAADRGRASAIGEVYVDLRREFRPSIWPGAVLLVAGIAGTLAVGVQYHQRSDDLESTQAELQASAAVRKNQVPRARQVDIQAASLEEKRIIEIGLQLRLPWNELFQSIESSPVRGVGLLSIESDNDKRKVKISAVGKDTAVMFSYLDFLAGLPTLKAVYLESHAVQEQDPLQPVQFVVAADWVVRDSPRNTGGL